jgi:hypothetical protein
LPWDGPLPLNLSNSWNDQSDKILLINKIIIPRHPFYRTNFVGLYNQLTAKNVLIDENVLWEFSTPRSPHFGGKWEAAVKSIKIHLLCVLRDATLTYEELYTVLVQIKAILNSRPLNPISEDPNDLEFLTPAHFLIGDHLAAHSPEGDFSRIHIQRLTRWQRVEQIKQHFWTR